MTEHPAIENLCTNQTQLDADGCMVGVSRQAVEETLAEIASLRALHDATLASCEVLKAQEAGLRAELASRQIDVENFSEGNRQLRANRAALELKLNEAWADRDKWCAEVDKRAAAARQDAEEKARLTSALKGVEVALARDEDVDGAMKIVLAALICTPAAVPNGVQQTEEIVRLREALTLALDFIKRIGITPKPKWWGSARAALACRLSRGRSHEFT